MGFMLGDKMQRLFEELYESLEGAIDVSLFLPGAVKVLIDNKEAVVAWVKSKEFKDKYANHPYPPLLNPQSLNYQQISPELAWELNLPLPPYFDFLFLSSHGSGSTGMNTFLEKCGLKRVFSSSFSDAREAYCEIYQGILQNLGYKCYVMLEDYVMRGEFKKYFALVPSKPAFYLVRDPISVLKHYLGMKRLRGGGHYFNLTCSLESVLENRVGYGFHPYLTKCPVTDSIPYWINFRTMCFHDTQLIEALINVECDSIIYVDMQEILGDRAFNTMCNLAQRFNFQAPSDCDREFFTRRVSDFQSLLPLTLYAHSSDLEKLQYGFSNDLSSCQLEGGVALTITTCYEIEQGQIDITSTFFEESIAPVAITTSQQDYLNLMQNQQLAYACSAYLKQFIPAVFAKKDKEIANTLKEQAVLEYFKEKPFFREKFHKILKASFKHLQANRPDIIKTWKYYAEFLQMCK